MAFYYAAAGIFLLLLMLLPVMHPLMVFLNRNSGVTCFLLAGPILFIAIRLADRRLFQQNNDAELGRMKNIIKNISQMVLITDRQKGIIWVNPALENLAGLQLNELAAKPLAYFLNNVQADKGLAEQLNNRMKKQEVFSMDLSVFKDKANPCWLHADFTPLFDDLKQYTGYIMFFTDISDIKKKEESLLRQNEVLREIAWIESHEVRRPLASILGLIECCRPAPATMKNKRCLR